MTDNQTSRAYARIRPQSPHLDCYGSAGSITFYHRDGKYRWRSKSTLSFTATPGQCAALDVHRRALAAWRTIPDTEKEKWHDIARNVPPHRPPFGSGGHITGHNLFVSAYHGFCTLGDEHIPEPVDFRPFPVFAAEFVSAAVTAGTDLKILLRLSMSPESSPERYALLCKVQLTESGKGCNPGKMRNFLAAEDTTQSSNLLTLTIPDYATFSGISSTACTLHLRNLLIDRHTGYRSRHQSLSAEVSLT